ncbi:hypothetical protein HYDPIDRAFT_148312 [Hydnomerulius pinastri MD-312]|nr:hypothetical protein HYDPIDRAFT_148312 [Hydnomerulius pinastri MD-312]
MPLPDNAPLSLQVPSSLRNAVQSKPKQAMIVRMSAETLEALEAFPSHPPMSFEFGDNPGIYIGETFFPMRPQKESSPHEIYLRASSAAKPMAPLKLYANVIGKFMVERQLGDKVTDKVRQQTMVAKQQHMERQAILLEQPPIPVNGAKNGKRKMPGSGTVVKKVPVSDQLRVPSSSAVPARKVSPLPQNPPSSKANADVRRRLVHFLAISPRLADDAVKMVGGANISASAREDLLLLLDDVAEQQAPAKKGDKSPRPWTLKPQTWVEVRPYEWPNLTEAGRTAMARQARMAFKALKIPESDPAWNNVRYRTTGPSLPQSIPVPPPMTASTSRSSANGSQPPQAEPKRPAMSSSRDTKLKSKQDASRGLKGEIPMKDESAKASASAPRVSAIRRVEAERPASPSDSGSSAKSIASRRLPGSGYQAKKSPQPSTAVSEGATAQKKPATPVDGRGGQRPPPPSASLPAKPPAPGPSQARKTIPTMPPKNSRRSDESDREKDRDRDRDRERQREQEKRERERERELDREKELARDMEIEREKRQRRERLEREREREREREEMEREKRQREREREREEMEREKRQRDKEKEREKLGKDRALPATGSKRKNAAQDREDTPDNAFTKAAIPKRRKLDNGDSVAMSSTTKLRDAGLPKKPVHEPSPIPRTKIKKESSPMPPPPPRGSFSSSERPSPSLVSPHKSERTKPDGIVKKLKRNSPIYTSSEDEGEIPQPRKRNPSPPPISDRSNSDRSNAKGSRYRSRASYPLPSDHAALRARYKSQYGDYLGAFSKIVAQKSKIEAILNGESEGDELMDEDDLAKLSAEHKTLKAELENIHEMYTKGTTNGGGHASD